MLTPEQVKAENYDEAIIKTKQLKLPCIGVEKLMRVFFLFMAVKTAEGPITQLRKKGYPSESRMVSQRASHLEVWTNYMMFLVWHNHCSCSVSYYFYFDMIFFI